LTDLQKEADWLGRVDDLIETIHQERTLGSTDADQPNAYLRLALSFFIVLILRSVRYAYESLGVSSNTAIFLLFATFTTNAITNARVRKRSFSQRHQCLLNEARSPRR